jgi:hypothetical protein
MDKWRDHEWRVHNAGQDISKGSDAPPNITITQEQTLSESNSLSPLLHPFTHGTETSDSSDGLAEDLSDRRHDIIKDLMNLFYADHDPRYGIYSCAVLSRRRLPQ